VAAFMQTFRPAEAPEEQAPFLPNLLAAMFQERRSHAVYLLEKQGIGKLDVLNYLSHGISKLDTGGVERETVGAGEGRKMHRRRTIRWRRLRLI
jgi:hypothetical protein